nr:ter [Herpesvirus DDDp]
MDNHLNHLLFLEAQKRLEAARAKAVDELAQLKDPLYRSVQLYTVGADSLAMRENELRTLVNDASVMRFHRFKLAIQTVHSYLFQRQMKLEPFQLELFRGAMIGIAWNQLKDDLYKYKHVILDLLGLAGPEIKIFNHLSPNTAVVKMIGDIFSFYEKPYTLGMAPRQCGKTTIMSLILATCTIFLEIDILVIAQNKNMSETIQTNMLNMIADIQEASWFESSWRVTEGRASSDTRLFSNAKGRKRDSKVTFVSSSPNAARGQTPDLILADEVCFVGPGALVGIIPIMSVAGRKQIHISSHQARSWVNHVEGIVDSVTGKPAYHVINQRFKCAAHSHSKDAMCPCQRIYCPSHVSLNSSLKHLINLVVPGGDIELTGGVSHADVPADTRIPFTNEVVRLFLTNIYNAATGSAPRRFFVCMDPTYASGTQSSVGMATFVELESGTVLLLALDEVIVTGIRLAYFNLYAALMMAHLKVVTKYYRTGAEEVVYVPEANTYQQSNFVLWLHMKQLAKTHYGMTLNIYMQYRHGSKMWDIGRLMSTNKAGLVMALHENMLHRQLGVNNVVFSFGTLIRGLFLKQRNLLKFRYNIDTHADDSAVKRSATCGDAGDPRTPRDVLAMKPEHCVDYIFAQLGGLATFVDTFDKSAGNDGREMIDKLVRQLEDVTLKKSPATGCYKVVTGGKIRGHNGTYTRDDLFSAFLLATNLFVAGPANQYWLVTNTPDKIPRSITS